MVPLTNSALNGVRSLLIRPGSAESPNEGERWRLADELGCGRRRLGFDRPAQGFRFHVLLNPRETVNDLEFQRNSGRGQVVHRASGHSHKARVRPVRKARFRVERGGATRWVRFVKTQHSRSVKG